MDGTDGPTIDATATDIGGPNSYAELEEMPSELPSSTALECVPRLLGWCSHADRRPWAWCLFDGPIID